MSCGALVRLLVVSLLLILSVASQSDYSLPTRHDLGVRLSLNPNPDIAKGADWAPIVGWTASGDPRDTADASVEISKENKKHADFRLRPQMARSHIHTNQTFFFCTIADLEPNSTFFYRAGSPAGGYSDW